MDVTPLAIILVTPLVTILVRPSVAHLVVIIRRLS